MQEFEHEISEVWRTASSIGRRSRALVRLDQMGMLDSRGRELRQSITMLREAADALQTVADKWQPYQEPKPAWAAYEAEAAE